ncbi:MAG: SDR family oxidoreductase [Cytophagaceae bacterium]|nr:SDR family oxidoreductase [Cytophagaceae bacterium]
MTEKILVTGATGTVGSAVVEALRAKNAAFVAASRNVEKATEKLGADVDVVAFEFENPATFAAATEGVAKVFLVGPPVDPAMDTLLTPFIHFLKKAGIRRVVYLSAAGAEILAESMPFHANLENLLKHEGFELTILRPTFFAQNFNNYERDNILTRKVLYSPAGQGKASFVDIRDVGEVAATVLLETGHEGKEYNLTGPVPYSYTDVAGLLTEMGEEPIFYPEPSPEEYAQTLKAAGAPEFIASYMNRVYALIRDGHTNYVSPDVEKVLGKKPGDLKSVLAKSFAVEVQPD